MCHKHDPTFVTPELSPRNGPDLFTAWRIEIGIANVCCANIEAIESCECESNTDTVSGNNTRVSDGGRCIGSVSAGDEMGLASEAPIHLDVEDHVA